MSQMLRFLSITVLLLSCVQWGVLFYNTDSWVPNFLQSIGVIFGILGIVVSMIFKRNLSEYGTD